MTFAISNETAATKEDPEPSTTINVNDHDEDLSKYDDITIDDDVVEKEAAVDTKSPAKNCRRTYKAYNSRNAAFSVYSLNAILCLVALNGLLSVASINAVGSAFSVNSILSIGSVNSFLAIGCSGGFMEICL